MKRFVWSIALMAVSLIMCGCEKDYYGAAPEEMITYTSTDGKAIRIYDVDACDAQVIANFYQDGVGYVLFDKPVTDVDRLFYLSDNLLSVTLPYSVTEIGGEAFSYCPSLKTVYCKPTTPPEMWGTGVFDNNASGRKIYVPRASVDKYKSAYGWWEYASDIVGYDF